MTSYTNHRKYLVTVKKRKLSRLRKYSIDSTKSEKSVTFSTQDQLKQPEISIAAVPSIVINSEDDGTKMGMRLQPLKIIPIWPQ